MNGTGSSKIMQLFFCCGGGGVGGDILVEWQQHDLEI